MAEVGRIVAETPEDLFWEFKAMCVELKLTQKVVTILAVWLVTGSKIPLEDIFKEEDVCKIKQAGLDKIKIGKETE